jgi:hypothetical protein
MVSAERSGVWPAAERPRTTRQQVRRGRGLRGALDQIDRDVERGGVVSEVDVLDLGVQDAEGVEEAAEVVCSSSVYSSTNRFSENPPSPSEFRL